MLNNMLGEEAVFIYGPKKRWRRDAVEQQHVDLIGSRRIRSAITR